MNKIAWCIGWFEPERDYFIFYTFKDQVINKDKVYMDDGWYKEFFDFEKKLGKLKLYHLMDNTLNLPKNFDIEKDKENLINDINKLVLDSAEYSTDLEYFCNNHQ